MLLKGVVDFSKEVERLQKELKTKEAALEKLQAKRADPNYASRCPAATQQEEGEKEVGLLGEVQVLKTTMKQFAADAEVEVA